MYIIQNSKLYAINGNEAHEVTIPPFIWVHAEGVFKTISSSAGDLTLSDVSEPTLQMLGFWLALQHFNSQADAKAGIDRIFTVDPSVRDQAIDTHFNAGSVDDSHALN